MPTEVLTLCAKLFNTLYIVIIWNPMVFSRIQFKYICLNETWLMLSFVCPQWSEVEGVPMVKMENVILQKNKAAKMGEREKNRVLN